MYYSLHPDFIGRDQFIEIFMDLGFRLKKRRNYRKTTHASKVYYPNIIKGLEVESPNIIWQSDIIPFIFFNNIDALKDKITKLTITLKSTLIKSITGYGLYIKDFLSDFKVWMI